MVPGHMGRLYRLNFIEPMRTMGCHVFSDVDLIDFCAVSADKAQIWNPKDQVNYSVRIV